ncbi:MAG: SPOR domain-containing protein [Ignavibacteriales bacterium]|nr:SPOR domain-containing protein [Ignavibacteriales bacterium]
MNKELLIQKIAKLLEVEESQRNLAFKIFISKISEYLRPNEAINIPEIGVFQLQQKVIKIKGTEGIKYYDKDDKEKIIFSPVPFELNVDLKPNFILIDITKNEELQELDDKFFEVGVTKPAISLDENFSIEIDDDSKFKIFLNNIERKTIELLRGSQVLKNFDIEKDYSKLTPDEIITKDLDKIEEELNLDSIFANDELLDDESNVEKPEEKEPDKTVIKSKYERPLIFDEPKVVKKTINDEKIDDKETFVFGEEKEADEKKIFEEELYEDEKHISKTLKYTLIALGAIAIGLLLYFYVIPDRYRYKFETFLGIRDAKKTTDTEITHTKTPVNLIDTAETIQQLTPDISQTNIDETINEFSNIPEKKEPIKTSTITKTGTDYSYTIDDKLVLFENGYYTIQVGAYKSKTNAEKLFRGLNSKGHDAYILSSQSSQGGVLYKVRIGNFSSRQEAEDYTKKI